MASTEVNPARLREFFHPKSVALIGATDRSRWSLSTYNNLKIMNFKGDVYLVHPKHEVVHGEKAYKSVHEIPGPVDLAYVMVSTSQVLRVMEDCHAKGIRNLILLTSGFGEIGEEGLQLEKAVLEYAEAHDQVILGPNGNGFVNYTAELTPYGLPLAPPLTAGPVGVVLQSGALASSVMALAQARQVGMSLLVSMGNETMVSATDIVDYLIEDEATRVIAMFLETIRSPQEFSRVAKKALSYGKPIVALKIGRSAQSARTAMAHTGALVGDDAVNDAAMRQLGVVRVNSLEDLITTSGLLGYAPPLLGRRIGVVTPSGGACDILSDRAEDEGLQIPEFAPETVAGLKEVLPEFSTAHNPLDVTGYVVVDRTLLLRSLEVVVKDPGVDVILCLTEPPRLAPPDPNPVYEQFDWLREVVEEADKPIVFASNTAIDISPFGREVIHRSGLHFMGGMDHGMTALGRAVWWYGHKAQADAEAAAPEAAPTSVGTVYPELEMAGSWSEFKAREFLISHGIPVVPGELVSSAEDAIHAAAAMGYPVALKIQSEDIAHKSDIGGVLLGLNSPEEVRRGYHKILENVEQRSPGSRLDGILVSPMRGQGTELLVGVISDKLWGHVLAVGLGGVMVEVLKDTSLRVLPVSRRDVRDMLSELRGAAVLQGVRGTPPADLGKVAEVIHKVAEVAVSYGTTLKALEVNPLWVHGHQVEALDALVSWSSNT